MKPSLRTTITAAILLLSCLTGSVLLLRSIDRQRTGATLEEVLYISSPRLLKHLSLGYDGLLADIYWTRVVQYFGDKLDKGAEHYDLLGPLLEITTTLDPHLFVAYEYGSNFLAANGNQPQRAIELVEFGIRNNPNEWRLYYDLGFIYYLDLKDYPKAAEAFLRGSRVPDAHPFLKVLAAQMAERGGDIQTARMIWTTTYQTTKDRDIRGNAAAHLRALQVDEDVTLLEKLVSLYRDKNGHLPQTLSDLEAANLMRGTPVDPVGNPYQLMPNGRVEVREPDDLPFIEKGTPPGYIAPKPKFKPVD
jgi:tetratricopeptide (TPR) repeat protein